METLVRNRSGWVLFQVNSSQNATGPHLGVRIKETPHGYEPTAVLPGEQCRAGGFQPRCTGLLTNGSIGADAQFQAFQDHGNPQHLPLLLGELRRDHVHDGRQRQEQQAGPGPCGRRPGPPGQPRHAVPQGCRSGRHDQQPEPPAFPGGPRTRWQGMEAHFMGRRDDPHRQAHEGGPRQELHCQERQGCHREPVEHHRHAGLQRLQQRSWLSECQDVACPGDGRPSIHRHEYDTRRRCPVWARLSAEER
jgi:hypothetical protein